MSSFFFDLCKIFKVSVNSGFVLNLADFVEGLALFPPEAQIPRAGGALFERCQICASSRGARFAERSRWYASCNVLLWPVVCNAC